MTLSVTNFTGTATIGTTETSMTTNTAGPDTDTTIGVFAAVLDLNAVGADDIFQFAVYEKARAADTQRLMYQAYFQGAQSRPIWAWSPDCPLGAGWDMTLKKISGTDRTITWSIRAAT